MDGPSSSVATWRITVAIHHCGSAPRVGGQAALSLRHIHKQATCVGACGLYSAAASGSRARYAGLPEGCQALARPLEFGQLAQG
eukprot:2153042-Amphidinium_carterae.2